MLYTLFIIFISLTLCDVTKIISYEEALKLSENEVILNTPVLLQIEDNPDEGYCGETSIQMILKHYGVHKSQIEINAAGNPEHPDLHGHELIPAIENVTNNEFSGYRIIFRNPTHKDFIQYQIDNNIPILSGFKLNPSLHPDWMADHFSVINGYDENGLYILTTWDTMPKIYRTWEQLTLRDLYTDDRDIGYSFCNINDNTCAAFSIVISKNK